MDGMDGFTTPPNEIDEEWQAMLRKGPRKPKRPQYFNAPRPTFTTEDFEDHFMEGTVEDYLNN